MGSQEKKRSRKKQLYHDIVKQVEFYFSPANLAKDRFMNRALAENSNGIELEVLLTFNRLKSLTTDIHVLTKALRLSEHLQLTENETRVKSLIQFKAKENVDECTIYVERLPLDANVEFMYNIFSHYGGIDYVSLPKFQNGKIKGFGFVEFSDPSSANKAIDEFKKTGSYLPIDMAPGNLRSICTFDKRTRDRFLSMKHKNFDFDEFSNSREEEMSVDNLDEVENTEPGAKTKEADFADSDDYEKKRKHSTSPNTLERKIKKVKSDTEEEIDKDSSENSPIKVEVTDQANAKSTVEEGKSTPNENTTDVPIGREKSVEEAIKVDEGLADQCNNEEDIEMSDQDNLDDKIKKKRRQKKKPNKDKQAANSGLFILSKADWKKLRNKYLNVQWEKMRSLKRHLYKCKQHGQTHSSIGQFNNGFGLSSFVQVPHSVVKISMDQPVIDIKEYKADIRSKNKNTVNIDVKEGSSEVHVRFISAEAAKAFTEEVKHWKTQTLTGEEEERYWSKIYQAREDKKDRKSRRNEDISDIADQLGDGMETVEEKKPEVKGLKDKPTLDIVPGTVVKIHTSEPIINIRQFKNDLKKSCKDVVYVDAVEGCCEAFARLDTADNAKLFTSDTSFGKVDVISGKEEESYWKKINEDRTNKLKMNIRVNKRGKQKIIKKAEKLVGKHILFEDNDMIVPHAD